MINIKKNKAGFTLIELMIVVAIVGVLAVLAIFGVRKYLSNAKTAEAKNSLGAISKAAVASYERENATSELLAAGASSTTPTHALCQTATPVPAGAVPAAKKYQPDTSATTDYNTGTATTGWKCLKFEMTSPQYYQYSYTKGTAPIGAAVGGPSVTGLETFEAAARGDLDGDGTDFSTFTMVGQEENKTIKVATVIFENNVDE